jgi:hypothetical protein
MKDCFAVEALENNSGYSRSITATLDSSNDINKNAISKIIEADYALTVIDSAVAVAVADPIDQQETIRGDLDCGEVSDVIMIDTGHLITRKKGSMKVRISKDLDLIAAPIISPASITCGD